MTVYPATVPIIKQSPRVAAAAVKVWPIGINDDTEADVS